MALPPYIFSSPWPQMEYQLASSSAEEGEITDVEFPYYKSYLQYYYYPHTTKFIGKNTVPHFINYKSDLYCTKLKKDIKMDYPYIPFNLLENSKTFFDNKFVYVQDLKKTVCHRDDGDIPLLFPGSEMMELKTEEYVLRDIKTDYKEIKCFDKKSICESRYDKFYQQLFFVRDDRTPIVKSIQEYSTARIFVMEDRILEALDKKHAYIFCRVVDDNIQVNVQSDGEPGRIVKKIIFEDVFYSKVYFYEYLDLYAENLVKSFNSEEIRVYENRDSLLVVYSSTTFTRDSSVRRLYNTLDAERNTMIICNKDGPAVVDCKDVLKDNIQYINNLDLPEGDYVINDRKVYKISNDGESVEYFDIDFSDFIRRRWE